jgi:hypothetical protein
MLCKNDAAHKGEPVMIYFINYLKSIVILQIMASSQHYDSASDCSYRVSDTTTSSSIADEPQDSSSQPTSQSCPTESVFPSLTSHDHGSVEVQGHGISGLAQLSFGLTQVGRHIVPSR